MNNKLYEGEYVGDTIDGRFIGEGKYTFSSGSKYIGTFLDGLFQGEGVLIVRGGKFQGIWDKGRLIEGEFIFDDGLKYKPILPNRNDYIWDYCSPIDPRFHTEMIAGLKYGQKLIQLTPTIVPSKIPLGCYDTIDGYYDPNIEKVCSYVTGEEIRVPNPYEQEWILRSCRVEKGDS